MQDEFEKKVIEIIEKYQKGSAFTARKLTDNPVDDLSVVNRKYVTRATTTLLRPTTSVLGECYFDTTAQKPAWWNGTNYQDATGNII